MQPLSAHRQVEAPARLEVDSFLEQVAHRLRNTAFEARECASTQTQLHAALGVQRPHLHPAVPDRRRQAIDQAPQNRTFARPGRAGDEGVGALDAESPGLGVIPEPDRDAKQGNLPG